MQNTYSYTRFFKPLKIYNAGFWEKLRRNLISLGEYQLEHPLEFTGFTSTQWYFPDHRDHDDLHAYIIYIAKLMGTKVMYREFLSLDNARGNIKGFIIIGEDNKAYICRHILDYTMQGIMGFEKWARKNTDGCHNKVTPRIQTLINLENGIYYIIQSYTQINSENLNRLENYIMGQYKLDYKNYHQKQNMYYNALSKHFHHRRMML